ncbi:hypothetical protein, partial [Herbaspirillum sp. B65]|uniref:hypothetical protein n=1 Tax=Herbaspirillum sp. B65 TaxID=137708 RepID=UPI00131F2444
SGDNFIYQPTQWKGAIKFVAEVEDEHLNFRAEGGAGNPNITYDDAYPYLHGRLLELLMGHAGKYKRISAHDNRKNK